MFVFKGEERMATWGGGGPLQTKIGVLPDKETKTGLVPVNRYTFSSLIS